ncbi:MAG TPA: hypothetical protein VJM50_02725, partial [Pyrinomonadaceae bacterium]|nr:hypothetical protein [Pyrinomonadaceae bacterium]
LLPPTGVAARFDDDSLRVGRINLSPQREVLAVLNWDDAPQKISVSPRRGNEFTVEMAARSGRLLSLD